MNNQLSTLALSQGVLVKKIVPIMLVILFGGINYFGISSLLSTFGWVNHTHTVIASATEIEKLAIDLETGQRGFLITGKEHFLTPYNKALDEIDKKITSLKEQVSDNPQQVTRLVEINKLIDQWNIEAGSKEIDERKKMSAALSESENAFRQLFEESNDAIVLALADNGRFIDGNAAALKQLGCDSKASLIDRTPWDISPELQPDGQNSAEKAKEMMAIAQEQGFHRFEWTHISNEGIELPVEISLTPMTIRRKAIVYGAWRDISKRKTNEEKLKRQTEELALHDHILLLINQGTKLQTILHEMMLKIEGLHPEMKCSVLLLDENAKHLHIGAAPSLPDFYNKAIDGIVIMMDAI